MKRYLLLVFAIFHLPFSISHCFAQPVIVYWDNDGVHKKSEENYKDGRQDGYFAEWYKNGKLAKEGKYDMGVEQGPWKAWYENGNVRSEEGYIQGKKTGKALYYYQNGKAALVGYYKENLADSFWLGWFENAKKKSVENFRVIESRNNWISVKNGTFQYYFSNGNMESEGFFENDKEVGTFTKYFDNGKKVFEGEYKSGKRVGKWTYYYYNGQKKEERKYVSEDDYLVNNFWTEDGKQPVKDGNGPYIFYDAKAVKLREGNLKEGRESGEWLLWNREGWKEHLITYANGKKEGKCINYLKDGKTKSEGNYSNDKRTATGNFTAITESWKWKAL
jgi:antitoxin component YwqK of YwqJK toxin-antitoxin module